MSAARAARLRADRDALAGLAAQSNIFSYTAQGDPPEEFRLVFAGRGLSRDGSSSGPPTILERHEVELRLPFSYPERPPDVRWLTPLLHPNVSFSGFVNLKELELAWDQGIGLDQVVERLWDLCRLAYANPAAASNWSAKNWLETQTEIALPVDPRPLRDKSGAAGANTIKYVRASPLRPAPASDEVLYIGDDTPAAGPGAPPPPPRRRPDDEDVLYIGD